MSRHQPDEQTTPPETGHNGAADDVIMRAIGAELRRVRDQLGLIRAQVTDRIPSNTTSVQALYNYEHGRPCAVPRLVEICHALGVSAADVLGLALQRAGVELDYSSIQIDLNAVVRDKQPALRPLRRWARHRLADDPTGSTIARLDRALLDEMAAFFGFTRAEFVKQVTRFTPNSAPQRTQTNRA